MIVIASKKYQYSRSLYNEHTPAMGALALLFMFVGKVIWSW
jgi:hypothetical protein